MAKIKVTRSEMPGQAAVRKDKHSDYNRGAEGFPGILWGEVQQRVVGHLCGHPQSDLCFQFSLLKGSTPFLSTRAKNPYLVLGTENLACFKIRLRISQ